MERLDLLVEPYILQESDAERWTAKKLKTLPELEEKLAHIDCAKLNQALLKARRRLKRQGPLNGSPTPKYPAPALLQTPVSVGRGAGGPVNPFFATPSAATTASQSTPSIAGPEHDSRVDSFCGNPLFEVFTCNKIIEYREGGRDKLLILLPRLYSYSLETNIGEGGTSCVITARFNQRVDWGTASCSSSQLDAVSDHFRNSRIVRMEVPYVRLTLDYHLLQILLSVSKNSDSGMSM